MMWNKIDVNVVKFSMSSEGYKFAVFARDDLSGWSEERVLIKTNSKSIIKFLFEEIICRYDCFQCIVTNDESKNKKMIKVLLKHYRIKQIDISTYHPQFNRFVEHGYDIIINSLSKYYKNDLVIWARYLPLVLWANRISVR